MVMQNDLVFVCRKCEHNLYITNGTKLTGKQLAKKLSVDCPNCGEDKGDYWQGLWIYTRIGNYEKDHGTES